MKLYLRAELEALAHRKWGGAEGLEAEQRRREARRETRAAAATSSPGARAGATGQGERDASSSQDAAAGAQAGVGGADSGGRGSFAWLRLPPLVTERIRQVLPLPLLVAGGGGGSSSLAAAADVGAAAAGRAAGTPVERGGSCKRQRLEGGAAVLARTAEPRSTTAEARVEVEAEVVDLVMDEDGDDEVEEVREVAGGEVAAGAARRSQQPAAAGGEGMEAGVDTAPVPRTTAACAGAATRAGAAVVIDHDQEIIVISSSSSEGSGASQSESEGEDEEDSGRPGGGAAPALAQQAATAQVDPLATEAGAGTASVQAARGEYVMYWMKTAIRGHENPALDAALAAATALRLPVLVAAFVLPGPGCQAHGNLRRIKFQLEGLRDAQRELQQRLGLRLHVHAEGLTAAEAQGGGSGAGIGNGAGAGGSTRIPSSTGGSSASSPSGSGWEDLVATASRAALVVTEDMPVDPDAGWLAALVNRLQRGGGGAATAVTAAAPRPGVWAVDTSCVVPMRLVARAYEKAWAYRSATEAASGSGADGAATSSAAAAAASAGGAGPMHRFLQRTSAPTTPTVAASAQPSAVLAAAIAADGSAAAGGGGTDGAAASSAVGARIAAVTPDWPSLDLLALPPTAGGGATCDLGPVAAAVPGVDNSVLGVSHMIGGSGAGYARWDAWRRGGGVGRYAASRNNAMQRGGTSRMSAYLHWGMVSPFRLTREAAASGGSGCAKFLDELLVWRELAYSFCFLRCGQLDSLSVLPRWAQDTLAAHAADPRAVRSLQQLEAGTTGDAFWDAAQRQLATHGELHNNVRMTWGKAPLAWCSTAQEALSTVLHLNHRFALDGCDPASYGGVLWCFGLFDGPKDPASTPVTGTLRRRPTSSHARRLDPAAYEALRP
ncbi:hypothetical protein HXX76_013544 [Chlamydomonas incerta]|uniref:Photolyase/cryptochrome alpha/beta domain-containing protein n=1 Tax=Chlamydomonas incerta TaxID=51695 RepID=A0A835SIS3_CHLIN|nr:hypothetical protein HXX76_013544 [Chlamydomonas incerta]|eukprot:KAG2425702.1 hypothetical protein HXX76_013544 [Chlamydomonas incerta]